MGSLASAAQTHRAVRNAVMCSTGPARQQKVALPSDRRHSTFGMAMLDPEELNKAIELVANRQRRASVGSTKRILPMPMTRAPIDPPVPKSIILLVPIPIQSEILG